MIYLARIFARRVTDSEFVQRLERTLGVTIIAYRWRGSLWFWSVKDRSGHKALIHRGKTMGYVLNILGFMIIGYLAWLYGGFGSWAVAMLGCALIVVGTSLE